MNKFKIPTLKIDSSDCVIHVGQVIKDGEITKTGEPHKIHENEWVEVLPVLTIEETLALGIFRTSRVETELGKAMESICKSLSKRIVNWNWTDIKGEELESPYDNPQVFKKLLNEELLWLLTATITETKEEEKKESRLSQTTS